MNGGGGADVLRGDEDNDTLDGGDGTDLVEGGAGDNDVVRGGPGADTLSDSGGANDMVSWDDGRSVGFSQAFPLAPVASGTVAGTAATGIDSGVGLVGDQVPSGHGPDIWEGSPVDDFIVDGVSSNHLRGGPGNDDITGSGATDILRGGPGADTLHGLANADSLFGDAADDVLLGGGDADDLNGGADSDTASYTDDPDGVRAKLNRGAGADNEDTSTEVEKLTGSPLADRLEGDAVANTIYGLAGADEIFATDTVKDTVDCGDDADTANLDVLEARTNCETLNVTDVDLDSDGVPSATGCNDLNANIKPGAVDIPSHGIDEDCSGADRVVAPPPPVDADGDQSTSDRRAGWPAKCAVSDRRPRGCACCDRPGWPAPATNTFSWSRP